MLPTDSQQTRKRRKPKRSLRKTTRIPVDPNKCLGVDMSQKELNEIFTGLNTGTLENPQEALAKVYTVALDALQNTLRDGVHSLCSQIVNASGDTEGSDNFFAPWLKKILPSDPARIEAFRDGFLERVQDGIEKIEKSLHAAYEADARGENSIGRPGMQVAEAIREVVGSPDALSFVGGHPLSPERLREIMRDLRVPEHTARGGKYRITEKPGVYHFSFGEGEARFVTDDGEVRVRESQESPRDDGEEAEECDAAMPSDARDDDDGMEASGDLSCDSATAPCSCGTAAAPKESPDTEARCGGAEVQGAAEHGAAEACETREPSGNAENSGVYRDAASVGVEAVQAVNQTIGALAGPLQETLAPSSELVQNLKSGTENVVAMASEVTAVMQEIAMQIAKATMQAYSERQFIPTLRESLRDDPRVEADRDLAGFIDELDEPAPEGAVPDNDELANAFAILLGNL